MSKNKGKLRVTFSSLSQEELVLRLLSRRVSYRCELSLRAEVDGKARTHNIYCRFLPTRINVVPKSKGVFCREIQPFVFVVGEIMFNLPGEASQVMRICMKLDLEDGGGNCLRPARFQSLFDELERREQALLAEGRNLSTIFGR